MKIYTSYFARASRLPEDIVPVSISLWPPRGYAGPSLPRLAPTRDILTQYKADPDWPRYVARFRSEVLASLDAGTILDEMGRITDGKDACLLCFEKSPEKCHRSLVLAWLAENGADTGGEL